MSRPHQRDTGTSYIPSQRQLRVGEFMQFAIAVLASILVMLSPAIAEVCDKVVGEHWRPGDGPAGTYILPLMWTHIPLSIWIILLGVLCFFAVAILGGGSLRFVAAKLNWLGYLCAALLAMAAVVGLDSVMDPDPVIAGAINEGCMSLRTEWIGVGAAIFVSLLFAFAAHGVKRLQRTAEAEPAN
jgi:hypothetical protein